MYHETVPSIIKAWTKYGEPRLHGNRETDLVKKKLDIN